MYHFGQQQLKVPVIMEYTVQNHAFIDINATVEANKNIVSDLPAIHALPGGCNTVSVYKGIKATAIKVMKSKKCKVCFVGLK